MVAGCRVAHFCDLGFITDETFGKNSVILLDNGKKITVNNTHVRTISSMPSLDAPDPAFTHIHRLKYARAPGFNAENLFKVALAHELTNQSKIERRSIKKSKR